MADTYESQAKGIRILPGQWRPHYPFEHIAWVSPPWPCQEYLWLDFPEAVFSDIGMLYLSHVNPAHPAKFLNLPQVAWESKDKGICFERRLPNGVVFGGTIQETDLSTAVALELFIRNGSEQSLRDIKLQTCIYLRGIREFSAFSMKNKYVHVAGAGWVSFDTAVAVGENTGGRYRLGWRGGAKVADLPVIAVVSEKANRIIGITWFHSTYSLIGNPHHPCLHADPFFPDLEPGHEASIHGEIVFFEGSLEEFGEWIQLRIT